MRRILHLGIVGISGYFFLFTGALEIALSLDSGSGPFGSVDYFGSTSYGILMVVFGASLVMASRRGRR